MNRLTVIARVMSAVGVLAMCEWLYLGTEFPVVAAEPAQPLKLGAERIPDGEKGEIEQIVALQLSEMAKQKDPSKRGQHPKHHGCVEAEVVIHSDIPEQYRFGLFREARSYKAKVRFSNGLESDDTKPDVHGMAIKVLGVKGPRALEEDGREEQDFILVDSETFFLPDTKMVLEFMKARISTDPEVMKTFAENHPQSLARLQKSLKVPASPLSTQYWSTVAFKLGDGAVQYTAKPAAGNGPSDGKPAGTDDFRKIMVERLTEGKEAVTFELYIIPQTDSEKMPIEDPTVTWTSDPVPVATIRIDPQIFDCSTHMEECEKTVFSPWHALTDHLPLGGINRARKAVYRESAKLRLTPRP